MVLCWTSLMSWAWWKSQTLAETVNFRPKQSFSAENSLSAEWPKTANNSETVSAVFRPKITAVITAVNCFGHTLALGKIEVHVLQYCDLWNSDPFITHQGPFCLGRHKKGRTQIPAILNINIHTWVTSMLWQRIFSQTAWLRMVQSPSPMTAIRVRQRKLPGGDEDE